MSLRKESSMLNKLFFYIFEVTFWVVVYRGMWLYEPWQKGNYWDLSVYLYALFVMCYNCFWKLSFSFWYSLYYINPFTFVYDVCGWYLAHFIVCFEWVIFLSIKMLLSSMLTLKFCFHSFIYSLIYGLDPTHGTLGVRWEYTLDGIPVQCRAVLEGRMKHRENK